MAAQQCDDHQKAALTSCGHTCDLDPGCASFNVNSAGSECILFTFEVRQAHPPPASDCNAEVFTVGTASESTSQLKTGCEEDGANDYLRVGYCEASEWSVDLPQHTGTFEFQIFSESSSSRDMGESMQFLVDGVLKFIGYNSGCNPTPCTHSFEVTNTATILTVKASSSQMDMATHMKAQAFTFSCGLFATTCQ